jgi:hypothetical protein
MEAARPLSDVRIIVGAASAGSLAYEEPATAGVCLEVLTMPGGLTKGSLIEGTMKALSPG